MARTEKSRLDELLVRRGLAESRTRAQALIMAGQVYSGETKLDKPGKQIADDLPITLRGQDHPWVSRGGLKLAHGLEHFPVKVQARTALDIGASTGGFTDVLLSNDAARVYAVDVGHGQLDWRLRRDDRVVVMERTNARHLHREQIPEPIDLIVCDASFIGLKTVLPAALSLAGPDADLIALIKPQFEVGRAEVGRGGVVRDPDLHQAVCEDIRHWLTTQPGWHPSAITPSPIKGPAGNTEFLIHAKHKFGS